jgi:class 3 adenylate cyclase
MHAYLTAMIAVVEHHNGHVIDIVGDGLMVFFGGKNADPQLENKRAMQKAGLSGLDMLTVLEEVVNKILVAEGHKLLIHCGVGVDFGDVIVTKIGTSRIFDTKAYGDCINTASKFSNETNVVKVSKCVRDSWPIVEKGKKARPSIKLGICGEHGGDPSSIEFCHLAGLNYVSCSPFRVPIARLAAAHAAIKNSN